MAYYDPLTGLAEPCALPRALDRHVARAKRTGEPIAIAFLDLDDFKIFNDTLGHGVGDALLKASRSGCADCSATTTRSRGRAVTSSPSSPSLREPRDVHGSPSASSNGLRPSVRRRGARTARHREPRARRSARTTDATR